MGEGLVRKRLDESLAMRGNPLIEASRQLMRQREVELGLVSQQGSEEIRPPAKIDEMTQRTAAARSASSLLRERVLGFAD